MLPGGPSSPVSQVHCRKFTTGSPVEERRASTQMSSAASLAAAGDGGKTLEMQSWPTRRGSDISADVHHAVGVCERSIIMAVN